VIVGGGPAGMMAGYLLARAGVQLAVLEKHADFNRDFRGDTIHPSTLELMHELELLDEFLKRPHQEVRELRAVVNGQVVPVADFRKLPTRCKFIAFMPQWDFLNFLSSHAKHFPGFQLHMETEVVDLLMEGSRVIGVRAKTPQGELEVHADLVIGADGRHSTAQIRAGLQQLEFGVPIDMLWMRISKRDDDPEQSFGFFQHGKLLVLIDRGDYWQCGFVIAKVVKNSRDIYQVERSFLLLQTMGDISDDEAATVAVHFPRVGDVLFALPAPPIHQTVVQVAHRPVLVAPLLDLSVEILNALDYRFELSVMLVR